MVESKHYIMVENNNMVFSIGGNGNNEIPFKTLEERERMSPG